MTRTFVRIGLVLLSTATLSCAMTASRQQGTITAGTVASGAFFAVSVADLDRMVGWYRDTLGFNVHSQGTAPGRPIRFALLRSDNHLIELLQLPDAKARADAAPGITAAHQIHGFFKGGFVVADLAARYERLKTLNVTMAYELGRPPDGPYRSFGVRDPEGNLLQFFGH